MDWNSERGKEPLRQGHAAASPLPRPSPELELSHRSSNISNVTDIGISPYEASTVSESTIASPIYAVASPTSLYSAGGSGSTVAVSPYSGGGGGSSVVSPFGDETNYQSRRPSWRGSLSYSNSRRYAPLVGGNEVSRPTTGRRSSATSFRSRSSYAPTLGNAIPEHGDDESYAMTLLSHPAPMGMTPVFPQHTRQVSDDMPPMSPVGFDVGSALGPLSAHDNEYLSQWQQQESQGVLSGGLGQGFRADSTLRDAELLASPSTPRSMSRSFTLLRASRPPTRAETIKTRGQDEADRLGRVIEVIIEEPSADLSSIEGGHLPIHGDDEQPDALRRSTFPSAALKRQIFFPKPNWKPWSMRWPHLTLLVLVSVGLAVMQEVLFRRFRDTPILAFHSPKEVQPLIYFAVKFLPTLAAVVYGVLWQFTDFEVRRLEAFYQLSKDGGALASESINVDYVTSFNLVRPIRALKLGHYTVAVSSLGTLLAGSLGPTFAAASVILTPSLRERNAHPDAEKTLTFSSTWSRLLTSTLTICAVLATVLFVLLQKRRSGLNSDVRGIAGLASMAVVSHILMDFKDMDTAKHNDIHHKLKYHRYMLKNSSLAPDDENLTSAKDREKFYGVDDEPVNHMSDNPHPLMLRPGGCVTFIVALVAFMGFVPAFVFTDAGVVTDKAPWFATAWAVCLKLSWNGMETAVRMMEPYYILSRRHAPSKILTLDYTALPFGYMPLRALANGHLIMFFVGFGSILAEFLTVFVTGLTTSDGQGFIKAYTGRDEPADNDSNNLKSIYAGQDTIVSFSVSFGLTMFVLLYMTVVATVVFVRRRHPFLPRQPNTIASVLAFIHQSKMLYRFVGTAKLNGTEMARRLRECDGGATYGLGWFEGRDGQTHCGVDQEELMSTYKHGVDYSKGNKPWNTQWDVL
ncbi:hypothetical protein ISF_09327 [Cordyceps fumosorosea ARSEF 2679]|uniref:DUF3433 domain protein n=1 Tax=Cordyceps fumosorosea (strain ARSEF 2679) TaxID=1081104 RepID=A0A167JSZ7_CORFA|nr:hypothetical protein ISF_09327 [Cordyceps fumosorosea ARSEF 2679]OAA50709.1 hypothetical protein ISF_09327 [Cordyceps fumosorosea ARSEF 2679]